MTATLTADDDATGWRLTAVAEEAIYGAEDTREGVTAFFERRTPNWTGR